MHNCLRQRIFQIASNVYIRCEIVAMEWLVLQVLSKSNKSGRRNGVWSQIPSSAVFDGP
ncbi:hypothetical protein C5167_048019 [Papaver somniferum]|uniref:Uncharacterized protein n=1 Tax=Papaver somniferum TaxID=3469 RepID=A0A4Y7KKC6_PAPSO|nr:hypothetical protein C5167_048019 [Papaver somniferum]